MIEISREDFVKRYLEQFSRLKGDNEHFRPKAVIDYDVMETLGIVLLDREGWQRIQDIFEDIIFLYKEYGLEDDSKLTEDAKELKKRVLAVKDDFRLEELKEVMKE